MTGSTLSLSENKKRTNGKNLWVNETFQLKKLFLLLVYLSFALVFLGGLSYLARSPISNMFRRKGSLWKYGSNKVRKRSVIFMLFCISACKRCYICAILFQPFLHYYKPI